MIDIVDSAKRSRMMASIRAKNTKPEMLLRRYLHARGFRFRIHVKSLLGTPDLVLAKYKLVIFVHGCFWHRHIGCQYAASPSSNEERWQKKFSNTIERDVRHIACLRQDGWRVFVIWECGLTKGQVLPSLEWLPDAIRDLALPFVAWPANVEQGPKQ